MPRSPKLLLQDPMIWVMSALFGICVACVIAIMITILYRLTMDNLRSQTFAVRLMQMTFGMLVGLTVTYLGVIVAWYGVTEDFGLEVDGSKAKGKLAAAGPGALLVICGTLLVYTCVQKEFIIYDTTPIPGIQDLKADSVKSLPS
ncbi:MAG: hypothetical protein SFX18_17600 [Pirellulales bacterium]|nr:hypothetical protein [Pirellulales bacterium]